jgi:uncharacterized protein (TIRG00374 family)
MRKLNLILLGLALAFLVWMLHEVGWVTLYRQIVQVGWGWPLLLLPYGLVNWLEAVSWDILLPHFKPSSRLCLLFRLRLAGEALNTLTPTAGLGGEPYKAARLAASGVPWEEATASVVIHKGIAVLSLVIYILLGLGLAPFLLPRITSFMWLLVLGTLGLGGGALIFILLQGRGPCSLGMRLLERLKWCPAALRNRQAELESLDAQMASFYRNHPGRGLLSLGVFVLAWVTHAIEVYLMFWLLGHPISWPLALCLDALAMLFTALGFFVPAALGVQDGGNILLALGFHLGTTLGAAFSILRRLREAFWMGCGLLLAAREK